MGSIKVIVIGRVLATAMVRSDVDSVSRNRYGAGEIDLLPATGGLVAKGGPGKPRTRGSPQVTHVCTGVQRPFVEANRGDMARNGTPELDTLLDRVVIVPVRRTRRIVSAEQAKGCNRDLGRGGASSTHQGMRIRGRCVSGDSRPIASAYVIWETRRAGRSRRRRISRDIASVGRGEPIVSIYLNEHPI